MGPGQIGSASWQGKDAGRLDQPEPSRTAGRLWCARVRPRAGFGALAGHRRTAVRTPTTHRRPMATQARRVHPVSILESVAPRVARDSAPSALARPRLGSVAKATGALGAPVAGLIALVAIGAAGARVGAGLGSLPAAPVLSPGGGTSGQRTRARQTSSTQIGSPGSRTSSPTTSSGGAPPRSTSTTGGAAQTTTASTSTSDGSSQTTTSGSDGADSGTTTTNQGY